MPIVNTAFPSSFLPPRSRVASLALAALLAACGGGGGGPSTGGTTAIPDPAQTPAAIATADTTLLVSGAELPETVAMESATPLFHAAPTLLEPPDDSDADNAEASADKPPHTYRLPALKTAADTARLTVQDIEELQKGAATGPAVATKDVAPMAGGGVIATYTPAQIRAAYRLPALPASLATLTATQAAQLGAGQTIYIVNAYHNPNVAAELAAFNQKFGLPACTTRAIAVNASLPLPGPTANACDLSVVYSTPTGAMTTVAPAYDAGWATEIALDVQWAHATAPLARIVLIEAPNASVSSLVGAIRLANAMGPGVVSMSFGAIEGSWTASFDSVFTAPRMTYLAATGDSGAAVAWPSVSPNVVAVGGTSLTAAGAGTRTETAWSGAGGGISAYTAVPSYQSAPVPGLNVATRRVVADVAFNADPATGQYLAVIKPGTTTVNWMSAGGTSIAAPQWAGLVAVANALRAQAGKPAVGSPHSVLYGQIGAVPGVYASAFADITAGSNGTCAPCIAKAGYDVPTGLGTPNGTGLLSALAGSSLPPQAPVVTPAGIGGTAGTALSFTVSVSAANPVSYSLAGAPSGMSISAAGVVTWAAPVAGTYPVTVTVRDTVTQLTGQGLYTVTIAAAVPPTVNPATVNGRPGVPLSFAASVTGSNPVTYSLSGAPSGMSISAAGVVSWASPVLGTYTVTVTARDTKTGLSGQGVYTVKIVQAGPVITAAPISGVSGKTLTGTITITDATATAIYVSISGVPLGMRFSVNGSSILVNWPNPVVGSYSLTVTAVDSAGLRAQAAVPVTVSAK
ncbi:MAG: S53 family peptidase [Betaproteobacteria bacterium]|nr:S53 family peptidase [Betaproteobacteria bacterium]